jgi:hypothetical protein
MKRAVSTTTSAMARTTVPSSSRSKLIRSDSVLSGHWIFRPSNPRRRTGKQIPSRGYDMQRREFFGLGEVIGVITNVCAYRLISTPPSLPPLMLHLTNVHIVFSQLKPSAHSPNPAVYSRKLVSRSPSLGSEHSSGLHTLSRDCQGFSHDRRNSTPFRRSWKGILASRSSLGRVVSERCVHYFGL